MIMYYSRGVVMNVIAFVVMMMVGVIGGGGGGRARVRSAASWRY